MDISSCYQLGYVVKTHGLKGELMIFLDVDYPEDYRELESVMVEKDDQLVPFFISYLKLRGNKAIIKLDSVDSIDDAAVLKSSRLYLPLDVLPELSDEQFYFHEIIGFIVSDRQLGLLGTVEEVFDLPNQSLIRMEYKGAEVLIPVRDEVTLRVDRDAKVLHVNLPDGLLDVYTKD